MYRYSKRSKNRLAECDERLQKIMLEAINHMDLTILCGHRGEDDQNRAFRNGKSKLKYPKSKHNKKPSMAVDVAPYPISWTNIERFEDMGLLIKGIARKLDINIEWGGDWKTFKDYPHFEIEEA
jgi:peptidoglycan L-alanyl-D-glutamate endopeptidase CwlK